MKISSKIPDTTAQNLSLLFFICSLASVVMLFIEPEAVFIFFIGALNCMAWYMLGKIALNY